MARCWLRGSVVSIVAEIQQVAKRVSCPGHVGLWQSVAFEKVTPPFSVVTFHAQGGRRTHPSGARPLTFEPINIYAQ